MPLDLEQKLKSEGYSLVGTAVFKEKGIVIDLSPYWEDKTATGLQDICDIRFFNCDLLPDQPKLNKNELYVYAKPNSDLFYRSARQENISEPFFRNYNLDDF